jgi:hypothetical protein
LAGGRLTSRGHRSNASNRGITPLIKRIASLAGTIVAAIGTCKAAVFAQELPKTVEQPCEIRPLPGSLDDVLMFNSNSPEIVQEEGILLSTFPPERMSNPSAHLNQTLDGEFNLFAHHINSASSGDKPRTLFVAALVNNPGRKKVKVKIVKAASYVSQPDAPFIKLSDLEENPKGTIYAGPGDRVMNDLLRGKRQAGWRRSISLGAGKTEVLFNLPIEVRPIKPALNGRSALVRLKSSGPVYLATLALFAREKSDGDDVAPTLSDWETILRNGNLAGPRDKTPTPPGEGGAFIYGRVAGVQRGSTWQAELTDPTSEVQRLSVPEPGKSFAYPISTVDHGTFGTGQIQSAPLTVRYPDTAYRAHGNYGVEYDLRLPLYNDSGGKRTVTVSFDTPLKNDERKEMLSYYDPVPARVFFRGTIELRYKDDSGSSQHRYIHLVANRGQKCEPLVTLNLKPRRKRLVKIRFLYTPDSTPPQVLTISTQM